MDSALIAPKRQGQDRFSILNAVKGCKLKPNLQLLCRVLLDYLGKNDCCWPSVRRLADEMNVSRRSIFNYLSVLEEKGIIKRESRFRTSDGGRTSNYYSFNLHMDVNADSQQELTIEENKKHVVCKNENEADSAGKSQSVALEAHNLEVAASKPQDNSRRTQRHANGTCSRARVNTHKDRKPYRIEPEAMGKPEYALKHYLIAVQQGWIDDSEHSLVMYFSAWSKCLRKQNAKKNPIRCAAAYMVSVIKGNHLNSFPSQQDEDSGVSVIKSLRSTGRLDF